VKEYLAKRKELNVIIEATTNEITTELISKNVGKTTANLRRVVLDFIQQNQLPEDVSCKVKQKIDDFISNIEIPAQKI